MKYTIPQLRLLSEADMSRREFLKLMGKAAAGSMMPSDFIIGGVEKLSQAAFVGKIPVRIDFFPSSDLDSNGNNIKGLKLSDKLDVISGMYDLFKRLIGNDVYSDYDYGQYKMYQKGNVDLVELVKRLGFKKLPPEVFRGERDPVTGERRRVEKDMGIWVVKTPFGNLQLTELDKWNKVWGMSENVDYWENAKKISNPVKDYWEQVGHDLIKKRNYDYDYSEGNGPKIKRNEGGDYFDEEAYSKLEEAGVDANSVRKKRQEELEYQEEFIHDELGEVDRYNLCAICDKPVGSCEHNKLEVEPELSKESGKQLGRRQFRQGRFRPPEATFYQKGRGDLEADLANESFSNRLGLRLLSESDFGLKRVFLKVPT